MRKIPRPRRALTAALVISAVLLGGTSVPASGHEVPAANNTPMTITASSLSISGLSYRGVTSIASSRGSVDTMLFKVSTFTLKNVTMSMPTGNGRATQITGSQAKVTSAPGSKATLHILQLKGKLKIGPIKIPLDFSTKNPPPLSFPWLKFVEVTVGAYGINDGDISVTSPSMKADVEHIALPAMTMTPHPTVDGDGHPIDVGDDPPADGGGTGGGDPATSNCAQVTGPVSRTATTFVSGIRVHTCIAPRLSALLAAAAADGIHFGGWGYRSYADQVRTRRNNCGTSSYAIYQMPAGHCSPPTARPGTSMHERGLAIDFTVGGSIISSRSTRAFQWLAVNAGSYGLRNLPSEPWHWSTNGH